MFERGLDSGTSRSSVGRTWTSFHSSSYSDSQRRKGAGVVPPGTASVARPLVAMRRPELVGDELGEVAHQRVAVGIGLARDLDHTAISRHRCPSPPVSL